MPQFKIVYENEISAGTAVLSTCWSDSSTFIFMPDKGVKAAWVSRVTSLIPVGYGNNCFGLLTSGNTGEPKLIFGNKVRSDNLVRALHELQTNEPLSETVFVLPLTNFYAFINQWLWAFVFKRKLHLTRGFNGLDRLQDSLYQASNSMLCMVGSQVSLLCRYFPEAVFPGIIRLHFARSANQRVVLI